MWDPWSCGSEEETQGQEQEDGDGVANQLEGHNEGDCAGFLHVMENGKHEHCECCGWKSVTAKGKVRICMGELNQTQSTGWTKEDMYVDSGATDTVCPKDFSPAHEIKETKESRAGKYYKAANDSKIGGVRKEDHSRNDQQLEPILR